MHGLVKGSMTLVDDDRASRIHDALDAAVEMSGGSAANTVCGVASLGGRAAYIGKVNRDSLGDVFGHDMRALGVAFSMTTDPRGSGSAGTATGRCVIVVTPDAERTMHTCLGMSSLLGVDDVDDELIADGRILYMEGYLFDRDEAKAAFRHAADVAHRHASHGVADVVGLVLRRPSPRRFPRSGARQRRRAVRQPRRTPVAVRGRLVRRRRGVGAARLSPGGDHHRRRGVRDRQRRRASRPCPPCRSSESSTPPVRAICSPRGSCTG